jgi:hypothetical protein
MAADERKSDTMAKNPERNFIKVETSFTLRTCQERVDTDEVRNNIACKSIISVCRPFVRRYASYTRVIP